MPLKHTNQNTITCVLSVQVAFGQVSISNKSLKKLFGVTSSTTQLLHLCNGDVKAAQVYSKDMKSAALRPFLGSFVGGKKCRSSAFLSPSSL